ncbi:MAG: hypothetical protein M3N97_04370, partial [Pseudomonadota bacterium]|nr:hypothetical protein [Pseudomonadota bacterium]
MQAVIHHRQIAARRLRGRCGRRIRGRARYLPTLEAAPDPAFEPAGMARLAHDVRLGAGAQLREEIAGRTPLECETGRQLHQEYREFCLQAAHLVEEAGHGGPASTQAQFMRDEFRYLHREAKLAR